MTSLPGLGTLPAVDRRHHGDRGTMTALPGVSLPLELAGVDHRHHGRHVGTTGTAARCQVDDRRHDDQLAELPGVDRRHHGHGRGKAPALARSMTSLPGLGTLARRRSSAPRGPRHVARSMTGLPGVNLPAVDRRHGHGRGEAPALARSMTALPELPAVSLPAVDRRHHGTTAAR